MSDSQCDKMDTSIQKTHEAIYWGQGQANAATLPLGSAPQDYLRYRYMVHPPIQAGRMYQKLGLSRDTPQPSEDPAYRNIGHHRHSALVSKRLRRYTCESIPYGISAAQNLL